MNAQTTNRVDKTDFDFDLAGMLSTIVVVYIRMCIGYLDSVIY